MQVARDKLVSLGVQLGRLTTHTGKFRLGIGALDLLAQHAKYKARCPSSALPCERVQCSSLNRSTSPLHIARDCCAHPCMDWRRLLSICAAHAGLCSRLTKHSACWLSECLSTLSALLANACCAEHDRQRRGYGAR